MTARYAALSAHLLDQKDDRTTLGFAQIETILGQPLPASAWAHGAWWSNSPVKGRHNQAWLGAGWKTTGRDMAGQAITFVRQGPATGSPDRPTAAARVARRPAFDPATLTATDLIATSSLAIELRWCRLGDVTLSIAGKLEFPNAPTTAGLYRLVLRDGNRITAYVGEAVDLSRRFGNYRGPSAGQQTSLRINAILLAALGKGASVSVDVMLQGMTLVIDGRSVEVDLTNKPVRRMIEQAAIVAHGGIDIEVLNR